jgi:hypothetical protein
MYIYDLAFLSIEIMHPLGRDIAQKTNTYEILYQKINTAFFSLQNSDSGYNTPETMNGSPEAREAGRIF